MYCLTADETMMTQRRGSDNNGVLFELGSAAKRIELQDVDIPEPQGVVAPDARMMYFTERYGPRVRHEFLHVVASDERKYTAVLPMSFNPILYVRHFEGDAGRVVVFKTRYPHHLERGFAAKLVGLSGSPLCGEVEHVSDCKFAMNCDVAPLENIESGCYLYIAPEASPAQLASRLCSQLNAQHRADHDYDAFALTWSESFSCFSCGLLPHVRDTTMYLEIDEQSPDIGFARGRHAISSFKFKSSSSFGPEVFSAAVEPGDYRSGEELASEIQAAFNRTYLEQDDGYAILSFYSDKLLFVSVPHGYFASPDLLAQEITHLLEQRGANIRCEFGDNRFHFFSCSRFRMHFDQSHGPIVRLLGFLAVQYSGASRYSSDRALYIPSPRYSAVMSAHLTRENKLEFHFSAPPCLLNATIDRKDERTLAVSSTRQSLGVRVDDVVQIGETLLRVARVPRATVFEVEVPYSSTDAMIVSIARAEPIVSFVLPPSISLLANKKSGALPKRVLGLAGKDLLCAPKSTKLCCPMRIDLRPWPSFVFIKLSDMAARPTTHLHHRDQTFLAKVFFGTKAPLFFSSCPMDLTVPITRFRVDILNPDHTPYKIDERDWNLTLRCSM